MKKEYIYAESIEEFYDLVESDLLDSIDLSYHWGNIDKMYTDGSDLYKGSVLWSTCDGGCYRVYISKICNNRVYSNKIMR